MSLTVTSTPTKTVRDSSNNDLYTSRWVAAHNPIVFKLSSSLFPVASGAVELSYINVTKSATGNARFAYLTFGSFDAADLIPNQFVKVAGTYSGVFRVINFDPGSGTVELSTPFVSAGSGSITKAYRNYVAELKVFAGLPNAHKWKALKPEAEIETLQQIPDQSGIAIFDIREAVQKKLNTLNDFELASLPNDVNIWTGFRVSYQERYDAAAGEVGVLANITATGEVGGKQEFTVDTDLELIAGDFVVLQNFDDDDLNGAVIRVISDNVTDIVLDLFYTGGLTLNGYETMQKFNTQTVSFQSGFTAEGNQYYAINAKLAPRSRYAGNMGEYLNNQNKTLPIKWISGFEGKKTWAGYYDDLGAIIDKTLTDSLATTETLAVQVVEKDRNGGVLNTQYLHIPNQEEGVYRLPYVQGIPPFIYELNSAIVISHLSYRRPVEFQYPPVAVDSSNLPTIEIDGTVQSARGDNFKFNDLGVRTTVRDREQFAGLCLRVEATNAGCFWDFSALGLTGVMTATVGWYKDSGGTVTLNKTLTGADPEIDNTNKRFIPQTDYKYHELSIFEDSVLFGQYFLEQRHDEVLIDSSGNGEHKTGSSVVTPALLWTSDNVPVSYANGDAGGFGYSRAAGAEVLDGTTLTAGEIIPAITASLGAVGRSLQYRGRCAIDGKLTNSPAKSFLVGATLTFINTAPYTRPANNSDVAINKSDGVVAGSYNAATGVFTISTAGRIDSLSVTVGSTTYEVFLCSGAGLRQNWKVGSVEFQIIYSAATVATTNTNAFNQARGATDFGTIYQSVAANTGEDNILGSFTPTPIDIPATSSFDATGIAGKSNVLKIEITGEPTGVGPRVRGLFLAFRNGVQIPVPNGYGFFSYTLRCKVYIDDNPDTATRVRWNPNAAFTSASTVPTTNSWQDVELTATSTAWNACEIRFEFSGVGATTGIVIYLTDVEVISNTLVPSALDVSGNSTGEDVFGNPLPDSSGFVIQDFGNSLKVNPNNVPLLRAGFSVDDTEELTYAQIVESVTGTGLDRFVKGGDTVQDYILADADTATPDDIAQIQNYENR